MNMLHLLLLYFLPRSWSISMCTTSIYINGQAFTFHVEEANDLEASAKEFCDNHDVTSSECSKVVSAHKTRCFPANTVNTDTDMSLTTEEIPVRVKDEQQKPDKIDYSQKIGPLLQVQDVRTGRHASVVNCQAFLGESKLRTVKRCCISLDLNDEHCKLLTSEYDKLLLQERELFSSESLLGEGDRADQPEASKSTQHLIEEKIIEIINYCNTEITAHWNWVLLIVSIIYVVLNR